MNDKSHLYPYIKISKTKCNVIMPNKFKRAWKERINEVEKKIKYNQSIVHLKYLLDGDDDGVIENLCNLLKIQIDTKGSTTKPGVKKGKKNFRIPTPPTPLSWSQEVQTNYNSPSDTALEMDDDTIIDDESFYQTFRRFSNETLQHRSFSTRKSVLISSHTTFLTEFSQIEQLKYESSELDDMEVNPPTPPSEPSVSPWIDKRSCFTKLFDVSPQAFAARLKHIQEEMDNGNFEQNKSKAFDKDNFEQEYLQNIFKDLNQWQTENEIPVGQTKKIIENVNELGETLFKSVKCIEIVEEPVVPVEVALHFDLPLRCPMGAALIQIYLDSQEVMGLKYDGKNKSTRCLDSASTCFPNCDKTAQMNIHHIKSRHKAHCKSCPKWPHKTEFKLDTLKQNKSPFRIDENKERSRQLFQNWFSTKYSRQLVDNNWMWNELMKEPKTFKRLCRWFKKHEDAQVPNYLFTEYQLIKSCLNQVNVGKEKVNTAEKNWEYLRDHEMTETKLKYLKKQTTDPEFGIMLKIIAAKLPTLKRFLSILPDNVKISKTKRKELQTKWDNCLLTLIPGRESFPVFTKD